jgi:hypothetical protein
MTIETSDESQAVDVPISPRDVDNLLSEMFADPKIGGRRKLLSLLQHLIDVQRSQQIPAQADWRLVAIWFYSICDRTWPDQACEKAWKNGLLSGLFRYSITPPSDEAECTEFQKGLECGKKEAQTVIGPAWWNSPVKRGSDDLKTILGLFFGTLQPNTKLVISLKRCMPMISYRSEAAAQLQKSHLDGSETGGIFGPASSMLVHPGLLISVMKSVRIKHNNVIIPEIDTIKKSKNEVAFVNSDEMVKNCGCLNASAFRGGIWRGCLEEQTETAYLLNERHKIQRNRSHYDKNPYALLLIRSFPLLGCNPKEQYIGFSHVIPLNTKGYNKYLRGKIKDNLLEPDVICRINETARAILIFSIVVDPWALKRAYRKRLADEKWKDQFRYELGQRLIRAVAFHVYRMLELYDNGGKPLELLAQNDGVGKEGDDAKSVINTLLEAGFKIKRPQKPFISGDGFQIWTARCKRNLS